MHIFKGEYTIIYTRRNKFNNKKEKKKQQQHSRECLCENWNKERNYVHIVLL